MVTTIIIATALLLISAGALSIGYIITGKSKLKKGCGLTPKSNKDCKPDNCGICEKNKKKKS